MALQYFIGAVIDWHAYLIYEDLMMIIQWCFSVIEAVIGLHVTEEFDRYCDDISGSPAWGGHLEVMALS